MIYYVLLTLKYVAYLTVALTATALAAKAYLCRKSLSFYNVSGVMRSTFGSNSRILLRATSWVVVSALVAAIIANTYGYVSDSAIISLNYKNASKGLNADGTRYNMSEILSDEVLERAIEIGAYDNITVQDLKRSLKLVPRVQGTVDSEYNYRISTSFRVDYNAKSATSKLDARNVLNTVTRAYTDWYYQKYVDRFDLLTLDFSDIDGFDYLEIHDYLRKKAENVKLYITEYEQRDAGFKLEGSEDTLSRLSTSYWQFQDVALENLYSYILENGLSKNRDSYIGKLDYESRRALLDYDKAYQSHAIHLNAIKMYENDMARIVLVPSYDSNEEFYMSRTKIGIDDFSRRAEQFASDMGGLDYLLSENNMMKQKLLQTTATTYHYAQADKMVVELKRQLVQLADSVKSLTSASLSKDLNEGFTVTIDQDSTAYWINVAKVMLFGGYLFLAVSTMKLLKAVAKKEDGSTGGEQE